MLPGLRDAQGRAYTTSVAPGATTTYQGGIAVSPLGQVHISLSLPQAFVNGFGVRSTGAVCVSPGGAVASYQDGLPRSAEGSLVTQPDTIAPPLLPFLGGLRVANAGVLTVSDAPP